MSQVQRRVGVYGPLHTLPAVVAKLTRASEIAGSPRVLIVREASKISFARGFRCNKLSG